jgi:6-phosphogluconolactonase
MGIAGPQIHRIHGELPPEEAAKSAEVELRRIVPLNAAGQPIFDVIFLGLGEDGHTASLFPGEPREISDSPAIYRAVYNSPKPPPERVTLGFPAIAAAKEVWMLASGKGKESALADSLSPEGKTPFAQLLRMRSMTSIFTDIAK